MADLAQWRPAVPAGEELVAAAPMLGDWRGPALEPRRLIALSVISGAASGIIPNVVVGDRPSGTAGRVVAVVAVTIYVGLIGGLVLWRRRWRRAHPPPTGMAAVLDRKRGPVLLVTTTAVLAADMATFTGFNSQTRPSGPAKPIPGLIGIDADGERLVLSFEDGSQATLRQRWRTPGAAGRVAALAAPVLHRI